MIKKLRLLAAVLTICGISALSMTASAQDFSYTTEGLTFEMSAQGTEIAISGSMGSKAIEKNVTLLVMNPDTSLDNWGVDTVVQNQLECVTDENGKFTFSFIINTTDPDTFAVYPAYIKAQGIKSPFSFDIPLITQTAKDNAVALLNGSDTTNISDNLEAASGELLFGFVQVLDSIDKSKLETKILAKIPFADDASATEWLKEQIILEAFRQSKTQYLKDENGLFLYADEVGISTLDTTASLSVYEIYTTKLNTSGLAGVLSYMSGKTYQDVSALQKEFAASVVIEGIRNYNIDGYGHINGLLTKNGTYAGLNLSNYTGTTTSKDNTLLTSKYDTLGEIQSILNITTSTGSSGGSSSGGSSGGGDRNSYSVPSAMTNQTPAVIPEIEQEPIYFINDIDKNHWGAEAVNAMLKAKIISMPEDKNFRPDDAVTREEFAKLLVLTFDIPEAEGTNAVFTDIPDSRWSASYVYAAYNAGIVKGVSEDNFGAESTLSRQDMATMIYRAFSYCGLSADSTYGKTFTDDADISEYAKEGVYSLCAVGAINGMEDGSFAPLASCTRVQATKVLYEFVD